MYVSIIIYYIIYWNISYTKLVEELGTSDLDS